MNWVLMLVLLVLVCCAIYGYTKGFLRIVFSLVAWVIVLVFVSWATPHVSQWIQENTTIYEKIEAACEESVRRAAQGKMEEGAVEQYGEAGELGLDLPESVMAQIVSGASGVADTVLAETGVYAGIAQSLAGFIVQGIAFVTVLILSWILVHVISALLGIVSSDIKRCEPLYGNVSGADAGTSYCVDCVLHSCPLQCGRDRESDCFLYKSERISERTV